MHDSVRDDEAGPPPSSGEPPAAPSGLLAELGQLGHAVRKLFGAQLQLVAAELGLARSAVSWMLVAGLAATVAGVGFALTLLGLLGVLLATWFHSWIWSLLVLALLQGLFLLGAILLFRRCMHWMSLPATRGEWSAMMRDTLNKAEQQVEADEGEGRT
ncbi:MAG: ABC transporter ATP-binding protein [Rhodanobacter sp.]